MEQVKEGRAYNSEKGEEAKAYSAPREVESIDESNEIKLNRALESLHSVERELDDLHSYITDSDIAPSMENCKSTPLSLAAILNDGDSIIHNHVGKTLDKIQLIRRIICNA